jgi:non-ribosomal peptide synthetase component E (peptide arylation enzyme)
MRDWSSHLTQFDEQRARIYKKNGWWPDRTLASYLDQAAAADPAKTAVVDRSGRISYGDLRDTVTRLGAALVRAGVEPGDVVTCQLPNWREVLVVAAACSRIGAVYNGIAPIFRERDMAVMLRLARPKVLVEPAAFHGFDHAAMAASLRDRTDGLDHVVIVGGPAPEGMTGGEEFLETGDAVTSLPEPPDPDTVAQAAFTSGTTGEPKGILHTHNTVLAATKTFVDQFGLTAADTFHMASTLGHQTGFLFGVQMPLMTGSTLVLQDTWSAADFVELIEAEKISMTNGAIPYLSDLLHAPNFADHDSSSLRLFGCFGAGLPRPLVLRARELLPGCTVFGGWGMTETGLAVTNPPSDTLEQICDTDGVPAPGTEIRILDETLRADAPAGLDGELVTRGPLRHLGFVQPELSQKYFLDGDWYLTGDRGHLLEGNRFVMTARSKDIIVRGGENIPVAEVEALLLEHPAVLSVAIIAVPDERLGEKACACVICEPGETFTVEVMRAWLEEKKLTRQYWPELVQVLAEFPTTASGKVQKFKLRERLGREARPVAD